MIELDVTAKRDLGFEANVSTKAGREVHKEKHGFSEIT